VQAHADELCIRPHERDSGRHGLAPTWPHTYWPGVSLGSAILSCYHLGRLSRATWALLLMTLASPDQPGLQEGNHDFLSA